MACPTCSHTMQRLIQPWFWCPRCGTVKQLGHASTGITEAPALVCRVREFTAYLDTERLRREWVRLGIEEAIER